MGYVIAAVIVVVVVAGFVTYLVLNSTRKGGPNPRGGAPGVGPDERTPLGDTDQHAGRQTAEGETVEAPEAGRAERGGSAGGEGGVGGEAEGGRDVTPDSERMANRPR